MKKYKFTKILTLFAISFLTVVFSVLLVFPQRVFADNNVLFSMTMKDIINVNGKIDRIEVVVDNDILSNAKIWSTAGWAVTDGGNTVTISNVTFHHGGDTSNADPLVFYVYLDEADADLTFDTANPDLEVSYTPQPIHTGTEYNFLVDLEAQLVAIATGDAGANTEIDEAAPAFISATATSDTNVRITMSEPLTTVTFGAASQWTATGMTSSAAVINGGDDTKIDLTVNSFGNTAFTASDFAFATASGVIQDSVSNSTAAFSGKTIADGQAPTVTSATTGDNDNDGKIDKITVVYSEDVNDPNYDALNVTGYADLNTGSGTGTTTLVYNLTEGGSPDTDATPVLTWTGANAVDLAGNNLSIAGAPANAADGAAPAVLNATYSDSNSDGKVDRIVFTFSENTTFTMDGTDWLFWTAGDVNLSGDFDPTECTGSLSPTITCTDADTGTFDASADRTGKQTLGGEEPVWDYTNLSGNIADGSGNETGNLVLTLADGAAPIVTDLLMLDEIKDGNIDRIQLTFSEPLADTDAGPNGFNVTSIADHGTCDSEIANPDGTSTLNLDFNCTTASTAVGDLTLNFTSNSGIKDASDNQSADKTWTEATTPAIEDGAEPVLMEAKTFDIGNDGLTHNGKVDHMQLKFSEDIDDSEINNYAPAVDYAPISSAVANVLNENVDAGEGVCPLDTAEDNEYLCIIFDENAGNCNATDQTGCDTGVVNQDITWTGASVTIKDLFVPANQAGDLGSGGITEADGANPLALSAITGDNNVNGKIDRLTVIYTEAVVDDDYNAVTVTGYPVLVGTSSGTGTNTLIYSLTESVSYDTGAIPNLGWTPANAQDNSSNILNITGAPDPAADGAAPLITAGKLDIDASGCSGGICNIGEHMIFKWDNSVATGDGNTDIDASTVLTDLSNFSGGISQLLYDDGSHGDVTTDDEIYTFDYTVLAGDDSGTFGFPVSASDTSSNAAGPIASTDTATVHNIGTGSLSLTDVEPADLRAGYTSTVTVSFTTANIIPANGKIVVTFPTGFDVSGATNGTCSPMDGGFTTSINGQIVTITRSGVTLEAPPATETCTIDGIKNPETPGLTGVYGIRTYSNNDILIDSDDVVPGDIISGLRNTSVALSNTVINQATNFTFSFKIANLLPADGKIRIIVPTQIILPGVDGQTATENITGDLTAGQSGQTITFTRTGGSDVPPDTVITLGVTGGFNGYTSGLTGTFTIKTLTNTDVVIDEKTDVPGVTLTQPAQPQQQQQQVQQTGGGGGATPSINPPSDSNTQTSSVSTSFSQTVNTEVTYIRPLQVSSNIITNNAVEQTKTVQLTTETGAITLMPNKESSISVSIPADTVLTSTSSWDGKIEPPLLYSVTKVSSTGGVVEDSDHKILRDDVVAVVKIGSSKTTLNFSIEVILEIPVEGLEDGAKVAIYSSLYGYKWVYEGEGTVTDGKVVFETNHFTYFALEKEGETLHGAAPAAIVSKTMAFIDITNHWAKTYIEDLAAKGIVSGKTSRTFAPDENITRAELTKIAIESQFDRETIDNCVENNIKPEWSYVYFPDVPKTAWYAKYVCVAKTEGIVSGISGQFRPDDYITRGATLKILLESAKFTDISENFSKNYLANATWTYAFFQDALVNDWYAKYVAYAKDKSIVGGYADNTFRPNNPITRAEVAKIVAKILDLLK